MLERIKTLYELVPGSIFKFYNKVWRVTSEVNTYFLLYDYIVCEDVENKEKREFSSETVLLKGYNY